MCYLLMTLVGTTEYLCHEKESTKPSNTYVGVIHYNISIHVCVLPMLVEMFHVFLQGYLTCCLESKTDDWQLIW